MGFSTTDWVAFFIFGASAVVGTFGKRLVRIIGLAVMPFAFAGLVLSLSHHARAPEQGSITNNAPSVNTNNTNDQSGSTNVLNIPPITLRLTEGHPTSAGRLLVCLRLRGSVFN